jgi:RNA polymerase sigma-70 factor (ECF subfamily)
VLALRAKAGDRGALDEFVRITSPDVHQLCRYLGYPADADDLMQETFERVLKALHGYRGDGPARSWVLSIARRVCVDATRRAVRSRRLQERVEAHAAIDPHWDRSWYEVLELLADLEPDRREAFALTQLVGLTYEEAADVVGCPIGTIRSRVARARKDLLGDTGVDAALAPDGIAG